MKAIIFLSFMLSIVGPVIANDQLISPSDYILPEHEIILGKSNKNDKGLFQSRKIKKQLNLIVDTVQEGLENKKENKKEGGFKLTTVNTSLGLGLSGSFGLLSWGGTKTIELFWAPKKEKEEKAVENVKKLVIKEDWTSKNLKDEIENLPLSSSESALDDSEKALIKDAIFEKAWEVVELSKAASTAKVVGWDVSKLRFDFSLALEAKIPTAVLVKLGGDLRIRFEWSRNKTKAIQKSDTFGQNLELVLNTFVDEFKRNSRETKRLEKLGLQLDYMRLGVAVTAGGSIGIVKGKATLATFVYLKPKREKAKWFNRTETLDHLPLLVAEDRDLHKKVAKNFKVNFSEDSKFTNFSLPKKKLRKGIKKSLKFARKVGKVVLKERKNRKWGLKKIKTSYVLSASGDVGVATLTGAPSVEFQFKNKNF